MIKPLTANSNISYNIVSFRLSFVCHHKGIYLLYGKKNAIVSLKSHVTCPKIYIIDCVINDDYTSKVGDGLCLLYYNIVSFGDSSNKLRTTDHLLYYILLFDINIIVYSPSSIYILLFIINSFIINHPLIYILLCYDDVLINQKEVLSYYD